DGRDERHGHTRSGVRDDGERPHLTLGGHAHLTELVALARRAGVATVEVPGPARHTLVGDEMRRVAQHQIVDERNLTGHGTPPPRAVQLAAPGPPRPNRGVRPRPTARLVRW